ncbi:MAG: hypothetical protein ACFFD2_27500 [Promethearchaeota archaeon]
MIYWALLLHIYQPPFQSWEVLKKINDECYSKLFDIFLEFPFTKLTLNINGSLTELLYQYQFLATIEKIKETAQKGQLRFTGSGKYHPLLPLIPSSEVIHQIQINEDYNQQIFGSIYANPKGFFPPELAISNDVLDVIKNMNYKWTLVSGIAHPNEWPNNIYYTHNSLPIFFRDDVVSNEISFKQYGPMKFLSKLQTLYDNDDYYIITAMDGETFGHHNKDYEQEFLGTVFKEIEDQEEIQMIYLDDLLNIFKNGGEINPIESTWSTTPEDLTKNKHYPLWADPDNEIQMEQHRLRETAFQLFQHLENHSLKVPKDHLEFYNNARINLDKGSQSCRLWWASKYNFNEDLIIRGNSFLVQSVVNAYKALYSVPLQREELLEIRYLFEDFRLIYNHLLELLSHETEERSRFKPFTRRIEEFKKFE